MTKGREFFQSIADALNGHGYEVLSDKRYYVEGSSPYLAGLEFFVQEIREEFTTIGIQVTVKDTTNNVQRYFEFTLDTDPVEIAQLIHNLMTQRNYSSRFEM